MTAESPSLLLQRAAERLERLADLTTQGAWLARAHPQVPDKANVVIEVAQRAGGFVAALFNSSCCNGNCYGHVEHGDDAVWIAAMSPSVAAPLVAWLRDSAESVKEHDRTRDEGNEWSDGTLFAGDEDYCPNENQALDFARLVLGVSAEGMERSDPSVP